jgi:hypothetical protein
VIHNQSPTTLVRAAKKVRSQLEKKTYPHNLAGMCGIGSSALLQELRGQGLPGVIVENNSHCFVVSNNFVVDVTASQFGFHRVVVWPVKEAIHLSPIWRNKRTFKTLSHFRNHQKKHWLPSQWAIKNKI